MEKGFPLALSFIYRRSRDRFITLMFWGTLQFCWDRRSLKSVESKIFSSLLLWLCWSFLLLFAWVLTCLALAMRYCSRSARPHTPECLNGSNGISDPTCRAGLGFSASLSKTAIPILQVHLKPWPGPMAPLRSGDSWEMFLWGPGQHPVGSIAKLLASGRWWGGLCQRHKYCCPVTVTWGCLVNVEPEGHVTDGLLKTGQAELSH